MELARTQTVKILTPSGSSTFFNTTISSYAIVLSLPKVVPYVDLTIFNISNNSLYFSGKYIALFLLMFSGIMRPSVTSGIYFLVFMGAATAWAVGRPLERGFAVVTRCVMAIMGVHIAVLLVYQCTWIIDIYPPEEDFARYATFFCTITNNPSYGLYFFINNSRLFSFTNRYFGLTKLVILNETDSSSFAYEVTDDHMWATLASPLVILFSYFFLAIETRELFKPKVRTVIDVQ